MTTTYRSNSVAVYWMPETTEGTDPGIVTASTVDGSTENVLYQPQSNLRAYARVMSAPDSLPKRPLVPVEQVYPVSDYDPFMAKGLRGGQEFSLTFQMHGGLLDSGSVNDTDRPVPPPWLALAASGSGRIFGHLASLTLGGGNLVGTNATSVATSPNANYFDIQAESGTIGSLSEGMVIGVDFGTGTSTPDIQVTRISYSDATSEFGDPDGPTHGAVYNGSAFGFESSPAEDDIVYMPCQVGFDRQYESVSPSYTILIMRPDVDTAYLCTGCRAKDFEITANFGEIPTIKITFVCIDAVPFSEGGTTVFGGTPTITDEPDYYSNWPCSKVVGGDSLKFLGKTTTVSGTTTDATKTFTSVAHGLSVGDIVILTALATSSISAGAVGDTFYVTAVPTADTFNLGTTEGGTGVDITTNGTFSLKYQPIVSDLAISNLSVKWMSGYTPRHSNMATEGTEDLRLTEKQDLTVSFTCLYRDDWRDLLGACYAVDGTYGTFPLIYWSGENRAQIWGFTIAAAHLKEDPGLDGDFEGNQAHTVTLGCRRYQEDTGSFAVTTLVDTKWGLFTF